MISKSVEYFNTIYNNKMAKCTNLVDEMSYHLEQISCIFGFFYDAVMPVNDFEPSELGEYGTDENILDSTMVFLNEKK